MDQPNIPANEGTKIMNEVLPDSSAGEASQSCGQEELLIEWMTQVNEVLCYQPEIPMKHKEDLLSAFHYFMQARRKEKRNKPNP